MQGRGGARCRRVGWARRVHVMAGPWHDGPSPVGRDSGPAEQGPPGQPDWLDGSAGRCAVAQAWPEHPHTGTSAVLHNWTRPARLASALLACARHRATLHLQHALQPRRQRLWRCLPGLHNLQRGGGGAQGMAGMAWQRRSAMLASPRGDARMGDRRASVHSRRLGLAAERPKGAALVDSGRRHRPGWTPQHAAPRRSLAAIRPARDAWLAGRCLGAGAFAAPEFRSLGRPGPALLPAGSHPAAAAAAAAPGAAASRCARWGGRPPRRTAGAAQSRPCTAGRVGASRVGPDALLQPSVTLWAAPCPI